MNLSRDSIKGPRLQRSLLTVPGGNSSFFEKAANSSADYVLLDLEDSVAPDSKERARSSVIEVLGDIDWRERGKTVSVRINASDTQYMYRDLVEIVEKAGTHLDTILIPKVGNAIDVHLVEVMLSQIEKAVGIDEPVGLEALIETALGMANVESIAASSKRLEAMHFGVADYAASCRARTMTIGGSHPDYPGDQWHSALSRVLVACRAYGLRPVDGPFGDFANPEGYLVCARQVAALGYEGKWAIHPSQIELANEIFSPTPEEIEKAGRILEELELALAEGKGAAALDGRMIDAASALMAKNVMATVSMINSR